MAKKEWRQDASWSPPSLVNFSWLSSCGCHPVVVILSEPLFVILSEPLFVILSEPLFVILSEAKDLLFLSRCEKQHSLRSG